MTVPSRSRGDLACFAAGLTLLAVASVAIAGDARIESDADAANQGGEHVVLVHGLGRTKRAMAPLAERLAEAGFVAHNLGYDSREKAPDALLEDLGDRIDACCADAETLHFVGHSLGGILIRAFLAERRPGNLGRVVLLSPPNRGSQIVDRMGGSWLFGSVMGPSAETLGTDADSFPNSLPPPYYEIGIIAATESINPLGSIMIPGDDDGMVAVCNMRLEGMTEFVTVDHNHALVMRSKEVARMTVRFLQEGRFGVDPDAQDFDPETCE